MKNLKTVITFVLLSSVVATGVANSESIHNSEISSLIYENSLDMFAVAEYKSSPRDIDIRSYGDNFNKDSVWSFEYEEYVNTDGFKQSDLTHSYVVNQYLGDNPTASGKKSTPVFIYNETAGEYHLQ